MSKLPTRRFFFVAPRYRSLIATSWASRSRSEIADRLESLPRELSPARPPRASFPQPPRELPPLLPREPADANRAFRQHRIASTDQHVTDMVAKKKMSRNVRGSVRRQGPKAGGMAKVDPQV